jgi:IclR family acetate operon transcriptional repressor
MNQPTLEVSSAGKPSVGSVVQAISVLRHLAELEGGAGVTAIASKLSISPSSCFNILKTLVAEEFLEFDVREKTYRLGLGSIALARRALGANHVYPAIRSEIRALSTRHDVAIGVWKSVPPKRFILVGVAESEQATRIHMAVGQRVPYFAGAIGRCAVAWSNLTEAQIAEGVAAVRWQSRPELGEYLNQVASARKFGWSVDAGSWRRGVTTMATPILDGEGTMQFGLTASMFTGQHDHLTFQQICSEIMDVAKYVAERAYGVAPSHLNGGAARG